MLQNTGKAFKIGRDHGYVYDFSDSIIENEEETLLEPIYDHHDFRDDLDEKFLSERVSKRKMKNRKSTYKKNQSERTGKTPEEISRERNEANIIMKYKMQPTSFVSSFPIYGSSEKKPDFFTAKKGTNGEFVLSCPADIGRYLPMLDDSTKQKWLKEAIDEYQLAENKG